MKRLLLIILMIPCSVSAKARRPRVGNPHGDMDLDCVLCHTEQSWDEDGRVKDFDHAVTGFVLEGLHRHAQCRDCHRRARLRPCGHRLRGLPPGHPPGPPGPRLRGLPHPGRLGGPDADAPRPRRHRLAPGRRPRAGRLRRLPLRARSVPTTWARPFDCYACHAEDYVGTTDPDHEAAGFGTDCISCHGVFAATWGSGDFIHSAGVSLDRAPTHGGLPGLPRRTALPGTPTDCVACHQDDYDAPPIPTWRGGFPHRLPGLPHDHGLGAGAFNHDATAFPLTGRPPHVDCLACHATGYTGTPTDCVACHQAEYDGTSRIRTTWRRTSRRLARTATPPTAGSRRPGTMSRCSPSETVRTSEISLHRVPRGADGLFGFRMHPLPRTQP